MTRQPTNDHPVPAQAEGTQNVISPSVLPPCADVDVSQIEDLLSLTPTEQLVRHQHALELVNELRKAGRRLYGFDPRAAIEAVTTPARLYNSKETDCS
jgi:hypothetical protein